MKNRKKIVSMIIFIIAMLGCLFLSACAKNDGVPAPVPAQPDKKTSVKTESLADVNEIPEDGIITKAMFETVAGEDKKVSFHGTDDSGIEYTWIFDCNQIQNPEDQNLKITFTTEGLDEIKKNANNAIEALMMTMNGKGLICVPTLELVLPENWKSDTVLLLKEQNGKLAKMSDVNIENEPSTKLTMNVTTLDGDCYLVGGIANIQNQGASAANGEKDSNISNENSDEENDNSESSGIENSNSSGGSNKSSGNSKANAGNSQNGDVKNNEVVSENVTHTCTISINCSTILKNMDNLTAGKEEFVPSNGWILKATKVEFAEGDSVHDVLQAVCKAYGIHLESSFTPAYNSAYVEGINQLYEFDCGELSGWMFNVNGWFPNYGCSKYTVQDGDAINWVYTCDLGKDVGDNSMH
ncbi:MAG: DUF4430 domain-containing protein [Eubacteriales bacterium]|nr:DUF4430 domain-containing protein [Eubacteriales bacterium]